MDRELVQWSLVVLLLAILVIAALAGINGTLQKAIITVLLAKLGIEGVYRLVKRGG